MRLSRCTPCPLRREHVAQGRLGGTGMRDASVSHAPGRSSRILMALIAVLLFSAFAALGTWQVQRRQWKHDLIARVDRRVHAVPVSAPDPQRWPGISAQSDEYRHVGIAGTYLYEHTVLVQAVTDLGPGFWVLTPLRSKQGWLVLINRGFVSTRASDVAQLRAGILPASTVTGLLRVTEPGGAFLRNNAPAANRWYSRDVAAIAAARGLQMVAPYFIDADAAIPVQKADASQLPPADGASAAAPIAGLTVIAFSDNHLVYALTWYALALMVAGSAIWLQMTARRAYSSNENNGCGKDPENDIDSQTGHGRTH